MKNVVAILLASLAIQICAKAQGNPPCYPTPYFATGGNWFIPVTQIPQEFCFLDQCLPIAGVNAIDMDAIGYKRCRVVAPNSHVSAVFVNYTCDTVLSVQCDGVIADTATFELDYEPRCLIFFLADVPDTIFVLPGPDSTSRQPQPYRCPVVGLEPPIAGNTTPNYRDIHTFVNYPEFPESSGVYVKWWPLEPWIPRKKIVVLR